MSVRPLQPLRSLAIRAEAWWFDRTRHVKTSGYIPRERLTLAGEAKTGLEYLPTRPSVARDILHRMPVRNYSDYTFVDLGSGMGRVLLLAAEHPFRKIQGVEFALELHQQAQENISRFHHPQQRCREIESIHADVVDFSFPSGNLVVFLFNPFGVELTRQVFAHLGTSLAKEPRHVVVAMVNPECGHVADATPFLRLYLETRRYRIYQNDSR